MKKKKEKRNPGPTGGHTSKLGSFACTVVLLRMSFNGNSPIPFLHEKSSIKYINITQGTERVSNSP